MGTRGPIGDPAGDRAKRRERKLRLLPPATPPASGAEAAPLVPKPEPWLGKHGRRLWLRLAPDLVLRNRLRPEYLVTFAALCAVYHRMRSADELLERDGLTTTTARGVTRPHPAVRIRAAAEVQLVAFMKEFGLTPASDARIPASTKGRPT